MKIEMRHNCYLLVVAVCIRQISCKGYLHLSNSYTALLEKPVSHSVGQGTTYMTENRNVHYHVQHYLLACYAM
jgi:hypothetical protein